MVDSLRRKDIASDMFLHDFPVNEDPTSVFASVNGVSADISVSALDGSKINAELS